jgi:hypothetical protein
MSQLVIETDTIKKGVLYFFAVAGIAIVGCWIGMGIMNYCISEAVQLTTAPSASSATASAPAEVSPVQQYPYVIEFTVLATSFSNGHYQVDTNTGSILYMPDFATWNSMLLHDSYSATIMGVEPNGALDAGTVSRVSLSGTFPTLPQAIQASPYPMALAFTVSSTTITNGNYEVITTTGQTLHLSDYETWNAMFPQDTYSATITGSEDDGSLDASTITPAQVNYPAGTSQVGNVMALPTTWTLQGSQHTGTVSLYPGGTGQATIDSYPTVSFTYVLAADGTEGTASYNLWSIPFAYNPATHVITSPHYPGAELVPAG